MIRGPSTFFYRGILQESANPLLFNPSGLTLDAQHNNTFQPKSEKIEYAACILPQGAGIAVQSLLISSKHGSSMLFWHLVERPAHYSLFQPSLVYFVMVM